MGKLRITNKELKNKYKYIVSCRYCELINLLSSLTPKYNAGVFGWNYDCYEIAPDIAIVTGYRIPKGNILFNSDYFRNYELEAIKELKEYKTTSQTLSNFINDIKSKIYGEHDYLI